MGDLRNALGGVRWLLRLSADERIGLQRLAAFGAQQAAERRAPGIDPDAIVSPLCTIRFGERVVIGRKANIGNYCTIFGGWETAVATIGAGALLGPGAVVVAGNHLVEGREWIRDQGFEELDATVGEGAWLGANCTVVGCRVGDGAVIGAGAVAVKDVPDGAIALGVPARVVGYRPGWPAPSAA
jgi:acetyltransferase-like isoleucine patch superfamily enzyme